jgi:hypothetical protein
MDSFQSQLVLKTVINFHVTRGDRNLTGYETVSFITSALLYGANYLVTVEYMHGTASLWLIKHHLKGSVCQSEFISPEFITSTMNNLDLQLTPRLSSRNKNLGTRYLGCLSGVHGRSVRSGKERNPFPLSGNHILRF